MMKFGRSSPIAPGCPANNGAKTLPDIPFPRFGIHPGAVVLAHSLCGNRLVGTHVGGGSDHEPAVAEGRNKACPYCDRSTG